MVKLYIVDGDNMKDVVNRLLKDLNEDTIQEIIAHYDIDDIEEDFSLITNIREDILKTYFSYIIPYLDNEVFYDSFDFSDPTVIEQLSVCKLFISDDFYHKICDRIISQNNDSVSFSIFDMNDYEYFKSKGYTIADFLTNFELLSPEVVFTLYKENPTYENQIMDKARDNIYLILADKIKNGDYSCLERIDTSIYYNRGNLLSKIIKEVGKNPFNSEKLYEKLSASLGNVDFSLDFSQEEAQKFIKNGGDFAIIYIKNPSKEVVDLAPGFSFENYVKYNGEFKNSPYLLLKLLNDGYEDSLFYAYSDAINKDVYEYIKQKQISPEVLSNNATLATNYYINKYLVENNDYSCVNNIIGIFQNVETFDFVYDLIINDKVKKDSYIYGSGDFEFLYYFVKGEKNKISTYNTINNLSPECADKLIDIGLNIDDLFDLNPYDLNVLAKKFYELGYKEAIFHHSLGNDYKFVEEHLDEITIEDVQNAKEKYGSKKLSFNSKLIEKFVKAGQYEILDGIDEIVYSLGSYGLDDFSYEEYLQLPDYVKEIPLLKEKYMGMDQSFITELLVNNPSEKVLETAALGGMPYKQLVSYLTSTFSHLSDKTVLHYLKQGELGVIYYLSSYSFNSEFASSIVEEYYRQTKELPDKSLISRRDDVYFGLILKNLEDNNFSVVTNIEYITEKQLNQIVALGYDFEKFLEYPILNRVVYEYFATKENEDRLVEFLLSQENEKTNYFFGIETTILKMLKNQYDKEHIKAVATKYGLVLNNIYSKLPNGINPLDYFDRQLFYGNTTLADYILENSSIEDIYNDLKSISVEDQVKRYIIRNMANKGHYEFVEFYHDDYDRDIVKEALLNGHLYLKDYYNAIRHKNVLNSLKFTEEEYSKLRSMLETNPNFFIFFPDIVSDNKTLAQYLNMNLNTEYYIDSGRINNIDFLEEMVKINPDFVSKRLFCFKTNDDYIRCIKANPDFLNYLTSSHINADIAKVFVDTLPNIIDYYYASDDMISLALNKNYVYNEKTKINVVIFALTHGYVVNGEFIKDKGIDFLFDICCNSSITSLFTPEVFESVFKDYFDYFREVDEEEFLFRGLYYIQNNSIISKYSEVFKKFGLDNLNCSWDFSNKDVFLLSYKIQKNPEMINDFDTIVDLMDKTDSKYDLLVMLYYRSSNNPNLDKLIIELANRYFEYDPMNIGKYVDKENPDIIARAKALTSDYPDIYRIVPKILDDRNLIVEYLNNKVNVYGYLSGEFLSDVELFRMSLDISEDALSYVNRDSIDIKEFCRSNIEKYPCVFRIFSDLLDNKDLILKLMPYCNGQVFNYMDDSFKIDRDIVKAYIDAYTYNITSLDQSNPYFMEMFYYALSKDGFYISVNKFINIIDQKAFEIANETYCNAFHSLPSELKTLDNFKKIKNLEEFNFEALPLDLLKEIIITESVNFTNEIIRKRIGDLLFQNIAYLDDELKNNIHVKNMLSIFFDKVKTDKDAFKNILALGKNFDFASIDSELADVVNIAFEILNSTGKVNTLDRNPVFGYDICKYVYPSLGLDFVLDLMKYNSSADSIICSYLKNGNESFIKKYYDFILKNNVFEKDDKLIHFTFRYLTSYHELVNDLINSDKTLSKEDLLNLRKIIINKNLYCINSVDELKRYNEIVKEKVNDYINSDNIIEIKRLLSSIFGYTSFEDLITNFRNFRLDNFSGYNFVKKEIIEKYGEEEGSKIWNEMFFNNNEIKIILLMKEIINTENISELKELFSNFFQNTNTVDYCDEVSNIIRKARLIYNYQYNMHLTDPSKLSSNRLDKSDESNPYGVTIIEMDSEKFNFLAHRLYSYDKSMSGFSSKIAADPSLWFKLEGASTLSTSSFSDKGFWFLNSGDPSGVVYLFNELPEKFMLFMYGRDLYVQHGGHRLEPTASSNSFTDIDSLNQSSVYRHCSYNEVAGFRDGMVPCAFACVGNTPNEDTIRAAKYFSEVTGKDIPIIKFNIKAYDDKKITDLENAKKSFAENLGIDNLTNIFYDGLQTFSIDDKVSFVLDILGDKYNNGYLSHHEFIAYLCNLESILNRIKCDNDFIERQLLRVTLLKDSVCMLKNISHEEIVSLETANMGESGVMYKYQLEDQRYLLKPAVEKKSMKLQPFRAEIQKASSILQSVLSPNTAVNVDTVGTGKLRLSKQELVDIDASKKNMLENWANNPNAILEEKYADALLREYVVDFLLCNFDAFAGNFIIDANGNLRGIDKEQSFRFIDSVESLDASFSFIPNGTARIPIYKILFERYKAGIQPLNLDIVADVLETAKLIDDDTYKNIFYEYAHSLSPEHYEEILEKIVNRREVAISKIDEYINSIKKENTVSEGVSL